ncbi:MAG: hypothetical protein JXB33_04430 [Clostridia bacterium]|nr:hypothetical protein [Clostridia bacterium]
MRKKYISAILSLILLVSLTFLPALRRAEGVDPAVEEQAREKLRQITGEEKEVLEKLMLLTSEIELLDARLAKAGLAINAYETDIRVKEALISLQSAAYEKARYNLGEILRKRQRAGAASAINILLGSSSLRDLIRRINLLRDLSKNTSDLMEEIELMRQNIALEKSALEKLKSEMEYEKAEIEKIHEEKTTAMNALATYLDSLETEKAYYEEYLESLEQVWANLKTLFSGTIDAFTGIIESGDMPGDTVEVIFSLFNTRGRIYQDKFNAILSGRDDLPELIFGFFEDSVTLDFPDYEVSLVGRFNLVDSSTIQYLVSGGTFYGLELSESSIADLFSKSDLVFSLQSVLGKNTIRQIDHYDGYIELLINISLF